MQLTSSDPPDGMASSEEEHTSQVRMQNYGRTLHHSEAQRANCTEVLAPQGLEISECRFTAGWEAQRRNEGSRIPWGRSLGKDKHHHHL